MHTITIEHKYQVGETVYFMQNNAVQCSTISGIFVDSFHAHLLGQNPGAPTDSVKVQYWVKGNDSQRWPEVYFFRTKEELLKTL